MAKTQREAPAPDYLQEEARALVESWLDESDPSFDWNISDETRQDLAFRIVRLAERWMALAAHDAAHEADHG